MFFLASFVFGLTALFPLSVGQQPVDIKDAELTVPQLLTKYKYRYEEHKVNASNGYNLTLHRILCNNSTKPAGCQPVLLMHGLMSSSANWVVNGPNASLGYILADAGYDVWMGNFRGNKYSKIERKITRFSIFPIRRWEEVVYEDNWDHDITTLGTEDTPTMISYVLKTAGKNKLSYVCYSLGCASYIVMTSETSFDDGKIDKFVGLAPLFGMRRSSEIFVALYNLSMLIGFQYAPTFNVGGLLNFFTSRICWMNIDVCRSIYTLLNGIASQETVSDNYVRIAMSHFPEDCSSRVILHLAQWLNKNFITTYQRPFEESKKFSLSKSTVQKYVYYGKEDTIVFPESVEYALEQMQNVQSKTLLENNVHFSLVQGTNVGELNRNITTVLNKI